VTNSFELYEKTTGLELTNAEILLSLDVTSLFTNVPLDLAYQSLTDRWNYIGSITNIPLENFIQAVKFVLSSTFFTFNNRIYKQTFGVPMDSPLSPIIADLVMRDLEESVLNSFRHQPIFYYRYVDDIILAATRESSALLIDAFNNYHDRLRFTVEYESNRQLNFLDLLLIVQDDRIIIDWYYKKNLLGQTLIIPL